MSDRTERDDWIAAAYDIYDGYTTLKRLGDIYDAGLGCLGTRVQSGQGAEVVAWCWENHGRHVTVDKSFAKELIADGETVRPLAFGDTHPQPAQQGVEPVAWMRWMSRRIAADDVIEGLEICEPGEVGDDGGPAFPVYTQPQPEGDGRIPKGWKLVPIASTSDMDIAAHDRGIMGVSRDEAEIIWTVMLAAAPQPPQEGEGDA